MLAREPITVACRFTTPPITEQTMTAFVASWNARTQRPVVPYINSQLGMFKVKLTQPSDITYVDELANMNGVLSVEGIGRARLLHK